LPRNNILSIPPERLVLEPARTVISISMTDTMIGTSTQTRMITLLLFFFDESNDDDSNDKNKQHEKSIETKTTKTICE